MPVLFQLHNRAYSFNPRFQSQNAHMTGTQPHRKKVKHFQIAGHLHELTFSCYRRRPLLTNDDWRQKLARTIDAACEEQDFQLIAFVFMPEHVHLLVRPDSQQSNISLLLARIKQPFSLQIKEILIEHGSKLLHTLTVQERPGKYCFRFWQEGPGFDRNLYNPKSTEAAMEYIHLNPVRRKLCRQAVDWKWSSARFLLNTSTEPDLPTLHRLPSDFFAEGGTHFPLDE